MAFQLGKDDQQRLAGYTPISSDDVRDALNLAKLIKENDDIGLCDDETIRALPHSLYAELFFGS